MSLNLRGRARRRFGSVRRMAAARWTPELLKETYLNEALVPSLESLYIEIGVRDGASLRSVRAVRKVGVDPMRSPMMKHLRPGEEFFHMTSDEFFAAHASKVLTPGSVGAALVDGLHEFRQALTDVLNLEPYMAPGSIIVLDDVNPQSREAAADTQCPGTWNGDVWKVAHFLIEERPDLSIRTIDADQGIGVIGGFGGAHHSAGVASGDLIDRYKKLEYDVLASDRTKVLNLEPAIRC